MGCEIDENKVGTYGDYSFLSFNIMKNITCYTGGALLDNTKNISSSDKFDYKTLSRFDLLKKIFFIITIQLLNSRFLFPFFFRFVKYSYKHSFNFFLKKYRSDFEVKIEKKFPEKFKYFMHPFQKMILLPQLININEKQKSRINKSKIYYENLKDINDINFPQNEFDSRNLFLDFPILCKTSQLKKDLFNYLINNKIDIKNYYYKENYKLNKILNNRLQKYNYFDNT